MYTETINITAGDVQNVGILIPIDIKHISANITSGEARLNGIVSSKISWVNPNPKIIVEAITDCVVELTDVLPVINPDNVPLDPVAQATLIKGLLARIEALENK